MVYNTTPTLKIKQGITADFERVVITFKNSGGALLEKIPTHADGFFYVDFSQDDFAVLGCGTIDFEIQYFYSENTQTNIEVNGKVYISPSFSQGKVSGAGGTDADVTYFATAPCDTVVVEDSTEAYDGDYSVTPMADSSQTLETAAKLMTDDVTVEAVPAYAVDNDYGQTITIGGI